MLRAMNLHNNLISIDQIYGCGFYRTMSIECSDVGYFLSDSCELIYNQIGNLKESDFSTTLMSSCMWIL